MTKYNDEQWDMEGDFDDMLRDMSVLSYREGVDAVMGYLDADSSYQIRCFIEEGLI